jgi:hypothetical protein
MTTSPLQDGIGTLEEVAHQHFGDKAPTQQQLGEFLKTSTDPKMDGGLTAIIIAQLAMQAAGLIVASWGLYVAIKNAGGRSRCPQGGHPAVKVDQTTGMLECAQGHQWK